MPKRWLRGATTRCRLSSKQDLLNTIAPCSLPGCPVVSVSPSHAHPTEKKKCNGDLTCAQLPSSVS